MSTQERARELAAQQRQHQEHLKESMLNRAEAQVHNPGEGDNLAGEHARQLAAQQRQHEEHLKESMLNRAQDEINLSSDTADTSPR